jgi:NAD+ diphosphatase
MTTPLTVHLPFNRDVLGAAFAPAKRGGKPPAERGHWLLVQGQSLLVVADGADLRLPFGDCPLGAAAPPFWLGTYHDAPCWVVPVDAEAPVPDGLARETLVPMRGARLPDELLSLGGMAMQALWWESTSGHCPRCGTPTERIENEWGKRCAQCRYEHYPHLHPATIVLVRDGDRVLLTRKAEWAAGRYALIAGFVDNGESLESCVAREIKEETGIDVKDIRYVGSQNWPFPSQMMIGFVATYAGGEVVIDRDELEDARWFPCDALPALPSRHSISRFIIDHYAHGGPDMAPKPPALGAPGPSPGAPR